MSTISLLDTDRLLYEKEVAQFLSIKVATLRRWRWRGVGPTYIKLGGAVRYHPADVRRYVDEGRTSSTSERLVSA